MQPTLFLLRSARDARESLEILEMLAALAVFALPIVLVALDEPRALLALDDPEVQALLNDLPGYGSVELLSTAASPGAPFSALDPATLAAKRASVPRVVGL